MSGGKPDPSVRVVNGLRGSILLQGLIGASHCPRIQSGLGVDALQDSVTHSPHSNPLPAPHFLHSHSSEFWCTLPLSSAFIVLGMVLSSILSMCLNLLRNVVPSLAAISLNTPAQVDTHILTPDDIYQRQSCHASQTLHLKCIHPFPLSRCHLPVSAPYCTVWTIISPTNLSSLS